MGGWGDYTASLSNKLRIVCSEPFLYLGSDIGGQLLYLICLLVRDSPDHVIFSDVSLLSKLI